MAWEGGETLEDSRWNCWTEWKKMHRHRNPKIVSAHHGVTVVQKKEKNEDVKCPVCIRAWTNDLWDFGPNSGGFLTRGLDVHGDQTDEKEEAKRFCSTWNLGKCCDCVCALFQYPLFRFLHLGTDGTPFHSVILARRLLLLYTHRESLHTHQSTSKVEKKGHFPSTTKSCIETRTKIYEPVGD